MDPSSVFAGLLGPIGSIVGGVLGNQAASADRAQAREILQSVLDRYGNIPLPQLQQMLPQLLGSSAMEGVHADPSLDMAQRQSLAQMQDVASQGGMTLGDRAATQQALTQAAQQSASQRAGIEAMLRNRGLGNSGASVAMQMGGARDAQNTAAQAALSTTQDAQRRALQAMAQSGTMAGQMRGQAFNEDSQRAQARDLFARYNANARQTAQQYNLGLPQQQFNNQTTIANGMAGAAGAAAQQYNNDANRTQQQYANAGTGIGQTLGSGANAFAQQGNTTNYGDQNYNPYYHSYPKSLE